MKVKSKITAFVLVAFWAVVGVGCSATRQTANVKTEIEQIMLEQSQAWSSGNLEAFMEPYWKSDSLLFIGKSGPSFGWDKTLQNYQRSYPTQDAMGKLTFTLLHVDPLSKETLLVVGRWHLSRKMGDLQGYFSLVFKKIGGKWKIIADHSS